MKKIALAGVTMALVMVAGAASAANSMSTGTMGLHVSVVPETVDFGGASTLRTDPMIGGKYFMSKDMAILGGVGFASGGPSGASVTFFKLMGGVRKYTSTGDFAPFFGGRLDYSSLSVTGGSASNMTLQAQAGAEYFLAKQFSVEGSAGVGFSSISPAVGSSYTTFGTATAGVNINLYF